MLAGLLLALIGVADIVRSRSTRREHQQRAVETVVAISVLWAAVAVAAWLGLGITPWVVVVVLAAAGLWVATTTAVGAGSAETGPDREPEFEPRPESGRPSRRREQPPLLRHSGSWPSMLLAAVVVVLVVAEPQITGSPSGFVVDWHRDSGLAFVGGLPLAALVGGLGSALFLIDSANIVVTSALPSGMGSSGEAERVPQTVNEGTPRRWWQRRPARETEAPAREAPTRELKGGRLIGPIERLLLAGFALTGAFPVVAALIAAKGIVRFPEINRATTGNPAEYFLIGSLVSWATAFGLAGMCWLLALA